MDLDSILDLWEGFEEIWPRLNGVSKSIQKWAVSVWVRRHVRKEVQLEIGLLELRGVVDPSLLQIIEQDPDKCIQEMVVLSGSAQLAHWHLMNKRPLTHEDLVKLTPHRFRTPLIACPVRGPTTFQHIAEYLMRVGEVRVLVGDNRDVDECFRRAVESYFAFQLHRMVKNF